MYDKHRRASAVLPGLSLTKRELSIVEEKSSLFFRSSYFLPSAESEETTIPPSPMGFTFFLS
jgi:hypothetical protein